MHDTRISCPICDWTTSMPLRVPRHLRDKHNDARTDCESYTDIVLSGVAPVCACGCGSVSTWRNWREGYSKYVNGHNGRLSSLSAEESARIKAARCETLARNMASGEVIPWSRGRTRETDERVAARSEKISAGWAKRSSSGARAWSHGLTKETDPRIATLSSSLIASYASGRITPWAKGLAKSDLRVRKMAGSVQSAMQRKSQSISSMKMLPWEEVIRRVDDAGLEMLSSNEAYAGVAERTISVRCRACCVERMTSLYQISCNPCPTCRPASSQQEEIMTYIRSLGFRCGSDRTAIAPKEIDALVEGKNFGVEHHGLYWHTERSVGKQLHALKSKLCQERGIQLLQVFGDEWRDKRAIIESMIAARLGVSSRRVGARSCVLEKMTPNDRRAFFNRSHLEGDARSSAAWCLRHNGEIVAALSVRRPKIASRREEIEIARFACSPQTSVAGGLGRLMKCAVAYARVEGAQSLMTYVDTRVGDGHGYALCGMSLVGKTAPRFWWTDMNRRYDRFKFKANKALGLSEAEMAKRSGVEKIWGCPNLIYALQIV